MKKDKKFLISFSGLKIGTHHFTFEVDDTFFEKRDYSILKQGNVCFEVAFEKKESMLILDFSLNGEVVLSCNRCNDDLSKKVQGEYKLIYTFGNEETSSDTIIVLHPDSYQIDIEQEILAKYIIKNVLNIYNLDNEFDFQMECTSLKKYINEIIKLIKENDPQLSIEELDSVLNLYCSLDSETLFIKEIKLIKKKVKEMYYSNEKKDNEKNQLQFILDHLENQKKEMDEIKKKEQKYIEEMNGKKLADIADGGIFGEIAVLGISRQRTATIVATDTCFVQVLWRQYHLWQI